MHFGDRLREERKRLRLTQAELAEIGNTTRNSQVKYEKEINPSSSNYLIAIATAGVDVQYLLTGVRSDAALTPEERKILNKYRDAPLPIKNAVRAVLGVDSGTQGVGIVQTINGNNNKVSARNK